MVGRPRFYIFRFGRANCSGFRAASDQFV